MKDLYIWKYLEEEGRSMKWLARKTGFSTWHVYHVKIGDVRATDDFQAACERVLWLPREQLFSMPVCSLHERPAG